jgi:hypothetical protein
MENENKEILTEVTSIAKEEQKTGQPILPKQLSDEEVVARQSAAFISLKKRFHEAFKGLSSKGKTRVALAVLDLPTSGIPVKLIDQMEKYAFMVGQQALASRFVITQYHINQEIAEQRRQAAEKAKPDISKLDFVDANTLNKNNEGATNNEQ